MSRLETRIPPLALMVIFAAAMWAVARLTPAYAFANPLSAWIGAVLMLGGVAIAVSGLVQFRRHRTTVDPMNPQRSSAVVTSGVYRFSRNPMYLGFLLVLAGLASILGSMVAVALLPVFVIYLNRYQIAPEERALVKCFDQEYVAYCQRVRRWL